MPQYLNALTIAANEAIADTGATAILIMDNAEVDNKRAATKPLKIYLPNSTMIWSTHVCDIIILRLPMILTGHIVPSLKIASLIGIRPLCKAGCKVLFDNKKCEVSYNKKVILTGSKDPSTDLWTMPIPRGGVGTTPTLDNADLVSAHKMFSCQEGHAYAPANAMVLGSLFPSAMTGLPFVAAPTLSRPSPCIDRTPHPTVHPALAMFTHFVTTRASMVKIAHQSLYNPNFFTLLKATRHGFFKGCPGISKTLILKYLNPSPATAKEHMKRPWHSIKSTCTRPP